MLEDVENEGRQSIVGWNPDGKTFQVHDHERFVSKVLPKHFKQSKYKSFQRQLNFYSFLRVISGPFEGAYGHPSFVKGNPELCKSIKRIQSQQQDPSPLGLDQHKECVITHALTAVFSVAAPNFPMDVADVFTESSIDCGEISELLTDIRRHSLLKDTAIPALPIESDEPADTRLSFVGKNFFVLPAEFTEV